MSLSLDPDGSENTLNLRASKWHCAVTYSLFGDFTKTIQSKPVVLDIVTGESGVLLFPLLGNCMF